MVKIFLKRFFKCLLLICAGTFWVSTVYGEMAEKLSPISLTLNETVKIALEKNLDVRNAEKELEVIQSHYRQALGAAIPNITLSGSYERNIKKPVFFIGGAEVEIGGTNAMNGIVSVDQIIYSGGRVKTGIDIAHTFIGAQKENIRQTKNDIIGSAKRFFYAVLLAGSVVSIQEDNLTLAKEHLETIQERYHQGLDSDLVVRRQEVEVANAKTTYIQAKNAFEMAKLSLQDILTLDLDRSLIVEGKLDGQRNDLPSYENIIHTALECRPELLAIKKQTEISRYMIKIAAGEQKPQLASYFKYQWTAQSNNFNINDKNRAESISAGLNIKYSLFTGGELREQLRHYRIQYDQGRLREEKVERAVKLDVRHQWLLIGEANERIEAQETAIDQAHLALIATEKRYRSGEASQLELNDITFALNRARTLYVQALHDYWVSLAALERAVGKSLDVVKP